MRQNPDKALTPIAGPNETLERELLRDRTTVLMRGPRIGHDTAGRGIPSQFSVFRFSLLIAGDGGSGSRRLLRDSCCRMLRRRTVCNVEG